MSASLVISSVMEARGHSKLAGRLLEPRYMVPALVGGGAGAYWLNKKLQGDWKPTLGEKIEGTIRKHPVAVGATLGGAAAAGLGGVAISKLLKKLRHHEAQAALPEPSTMPPISIQIGDQSMLPEQLKAAGLKSLGALVKAYGGLGRAGAVGAGQALKTVGRGTLDAAKWGLGQGRKYTGMGQVESEHAARKAIMADPKLRQAYETLSQHLKTRGVGPRTGVGGWLMNPGGAIGRHFSAAGRVGWDLEQLGNPEFVKQVTHGASPRLATSIKELQGMHLPGAGGQMTPAVEHLRQQAGSGWLVPSVLAGSVAAPMIMGDSSRKARVAAPDSPGARRGALQTGADVAGGWLGKNVSPTVGNWVQQHPYASTGIAGGGAAGLGLLGARALGGSNQ